MTQQSQPQPTVATSDSTVPTNAFSVVLVVAIGKDAHLVPRNHIVFCTTFNVEVSVLSNGGYVSLYILRSTTPGVQPLLPAISGIHSPSATITGVPSSFIIDTTTQHPCSTVAGDEPVHDPVARIELTVASKHANKLTSTTIHFACSDVQSSVWELALRSIIHDVWWFSISTRGNPDEEYQTAFCQELL